MTDQDPKHFKDIETGAGVVRVKKLALKDYAEFIRTLRTLPAGLADLFKSGKDVQDMAVLFEELPEILANGFPDFINLLAVATDKDQAFFDNPDFDLADAIDVVQAALELNDYERIVASIKKIMGRRAAENQTAKAQSAAEPKQ
jgi:hypothetical protein